MTPSDIDKAMQTNARLEAKNARQKERQETLRSEEFMFPVAAVGLGLCVVLVVTALMLAAVLSPDQNAITREKSFRYCMEADGSWITDPNNKDKYACMQPGADLPSQPLYKKSE